MPWIEPDRQKQIESEACQLPAGERDAFVVQQCGDDVAARDRILGKLRWLARLDGSLLGPDKESPQVYLDVPPEVGPYSPIKRLGGGGFGEVWKAQDKAGFHVAIKILQDRSAKERFKREFNVLDSLNHPLIVGGVHKIDELPDGRLWYAMDLVEDAVSLTKYCSGKGIEKGLTLFHDVCLAVEHAHSRGIWHRDLSPANILVSRSGNVKLIDFGSAKDFGNDPVRDPQFSKVPWTEPYAAPERLLGKPANEQWDIWALGVILYELLTGMQPFRGFEAIQKKQESPSSLATKSGRPLDESRWDDLDRICNKALRKEPVERYRSVTQLKEAVKRYLERKPYREKRSSGHEARQFFYKIRQGAAVGATLAVLFSYYVATEKVRGVVDVIDSIQYDITAGDHNNELDDEARLKKYEAAEIQLRGVIERADASGGDKPESGEARILMGSVLCRRGNMGEAKAHTEGGLTIISRHTKVAPQVWWFLRSWRRLNLALVAQGTADLKKEEQALKNSQQ